MSQDLLDQMHNEADKFADETEALQKRYKEVRKKLEVELATKTPENVATLLDRLEALQDELEISKVSFVLECSWLGYCFVWY